MENEIEYINKADSATCNTSSHITGSECEKALHRDITLSWIANCVPGGMSCVNQYIIVNTLKYELLTLFCL